ncbi:glucose transporter [Fimicolochytrium jonesii]|uniref:glucose transporter n=1 Tax=Fimicolochytrium jonesii TaxID=1396493 RepID=UPI0022FE663D|nr:glucose transporter [Fimicolochytrium jonesii]KAI8816749.1 glucose transporter [Fimicolochytrium jonesii]
MAKSVNTSTILICLFVSFGGFLFGYDTGLISGILEMRAFKDDFGPGNGAQVASHIKSLLVSILSVGTFVGSLVAGMLADKFGRRIAIMQSAAVFIVGVCLQTAGHNLGLMLPGRLIAGMGVGLLSGLIPLYQAEAAPKHLRGTLVSTYQLAITIGILAAFGINQGTQNISGRASYRTPIGLQLFFASVLLIGMIFLPESPRNLLRQDKRDAALRALSRLRGRPPHDPLIVDEMQELESNLALEAQIGEAQSYADCFRGNAARRTHIAVWIQMFQQLTGVNFVFYYGTTFFKQAGIKQAYLTSTITGVVNVLSTIPALWWVERMGRRKLLILGSMIMLVAQLVVGVVGTARAPTLDPVTGDPIGNVDSNAGIVMIVFECLFIFGFASSWGPAAWVVSSEIFPLRLRSKGVALATASNWFWNWALGFSTPYLVDVGEANLGAKIAFLWAAFILAGGVFVYIFVPETKGLALEDVDEMFTSGISARNSSKYIVKDKHNPNPNANRLAGAKSDMTLDEEPRV